MPDSSNCFIFFLAHSLSLALSLSRTIGAKLDQDVPFPFKVRHSFLVYAVFFLSSHVDRPCPAQLTNRKEESPTQLNIFKNEWTGPVQRYYNIDALVSVYEVPCPLYCTVHKLTMTSLVLFSRMYYTPAKSKVEKRPQ